MQSVVDLHNNADATDKRFDNSVNKMVADRRKARDGPEQHKFSEADKLRMQGKKAENDCVHGTHKFDNKLMLNMHN